MCVLKLRIARGESLGRKVTPYMGVCIETGTIRRNANLHIVTPYMGVCIETLRKINVWEPIGSHPIWVCVLKHLSRIAILR